MMMPPLNFPAFIPRLQRASSGKTSIFDPVRKRFVALTPEEWVRQHLIHYLVAYKSVPVSLIGVEVPVQYNRLKKRSDVLVYGSDHKPLLLAECKAPEVKLSTDTLNQLLMYYASFSGQILVLTNGITHLYCKINKKESKIDLIPDLPDYKEMIINPKP